MSLFRGTGADGALHFDGVSSVAHCSLSGGVYGVGADLNASSIIVDSGVVIKTQNFKILCTGTVLNNGTIHNNGEDGVNGGVISGGAGHTSDFSTGGTLVAVAPLLASQGAFGGTADNAGGCGPAFGLGCDSVQGTGAPQAGGGSGGHGGHTGGGTGGTAHDGWAGGLGTAGGGGGGGSGAKGSIFGVAGVGAQGGYAGGNGGYLFLSGSTITNNGTISSNGGNGGNGDNGTAGRNEAGGGGGGGGGVGGNGGTIILYAHALAGGGVYQVNPGAGGLKGHGGAAGTGGDLPGADGTNGSSGGAGAVYFNPLNPGDLDYSAATLFFALPRTSSSQESQSGVAGSGQLGGFVIHVVPLSRL